MSLLIFYWFLLSTLYQASYPQIIPQAAVFEDKILGGSRLPICYSKCNGCNPCLPVQVPIPPKKKGAAVARLARKPTVSGSGRVRDTASPSALNQESDYKPIRWQCGCGGRTYNP